MARAGQCGMHPGDPKSRAAADEIGKFSAEAARWWDPRGPFAPLHRLNPLRVHYVRDRLCEAFQKDARAPRSLDGLAILDIGSGGGLACEPLARLGGRVTGVEPGPENVAAARAHAAGEGLDIAYRTGFAEDLARDGMTFDAVLALEVVEHVPDVAGFVRTAASLVRPGGMLILSTLNRTAKAYLLLIVGAEYILNWVPRGTHSWEKFVKPDELSDHLTGAGLTIADRQGMIYSPLSDGWRLGPDMDVNYIVTARRTL